VAVKPSVVILCEGKSDEEILKVLFKKERLYHINPLLQPLDGVTEFKERNIRSRVCSSLKRPGVLAVFALIDLKGSRVDYPPNITSYTNRAKFLKEHLKKFLSGLPESDRFYPHVAVHDIEAWILADKDAVAKYLKTSTIAYKADVPESIDFNRPPSYILKDLFRDKELVYRKTVHGPDLFRTVNIDIVYNKCPHFKDFIDDLLKVT